MSRRDFWICIAIILTIFTLGVMVGMCVQVLGVPVHACAEAEEYVSGMPCENKEQFERWYKNYEQKTAEETQKEVEQSAGSEEISEDFGRLGSTGYSQVDHESTEESAQSNETLYKIDGCLIDPDIQRKLYNYLKAEGVEYWYTGALCQMYQESRGQQFAENPNGLDKGLYQYRITYWNWNDGDIFDVDSQLRRYAQEMSARFNSGLSVDEAISRHNTSDYVTEINWTYVQQVRQWEQYLSEVE